MKQLFQKIKELNENGINTVLVTVIECSGSTPRDPGAHMLVWQDGFFGTIGGGAVEHKALQTAFEVLMERKSRIKSFRLAANREEDLGMICGGEMSLYFQYIPCEDKSLGEFFGVIAEKADGDENVWLVLDITDEQACRMALVSRGEGIFELDPAAAEVLKGTRAVQRAIKGRTYFSSPVIRAGTVYIFGGGHVSRELVPMLAHLEFRCVVMDDRPEYTLAERFPDAHRTILGDFERLSDYINITSDDYVVIMTRGHQYDYQIIRQVLRTDAYYIGVMGSKTKMKAQIAKLLAEGFTQSDVDRLHTPIGTAIMAETPAELAVSIAGELIHERARRVKGEK